MQCQAKCKSTGVQCRRSAVKGKRVCTVHGGLNPGPKKGNKNAEKTGLYSSISKETMFDEEIDFCNNVKVDPIKDLTDQIKILRVKEKRILKRMKDTLDAEQKAKNPSTDGKKHPTTVMLSVQTTQTTHSNGQVTKTATSNSETFSAYYLRLDQAHSQLLEMIRRAENNLTRLKNEMNISNEENESSGVLVTPGLFSEEAWEQEIKKS